MVDSQDTNERALPLVLMFLCLFRGSYLVYMSCAPRAIRTPGLGSRVVSSLHCIIVVALAGSYLAGAISSPELLVGRYITVGYLSHDLWLVLREPSLRKMEDIVHHVAFFTVLPGAHLYPYYYARGMLAETSLPFLYTSYGLIKLNRVKTMPILFWSVSILGVVMFFVFRVINFTTLMHHVYYNHTWPVIIAGAALTGLNYYWFCKLLTKCESSPSVD
jgi:hypothetical protein